MCIIRIINKTKYLALGTALAALLASCGGGAGSGGSGAATVFNPADSLQVPGYMLGRNMGQAVLEMKEAGVGFDNATLIMAFKEVLDGVPSKLSDSVLAAVDNNFKMELNAKRRVKRKQIEDEAMKAASAFLEKSKSEEGVKVTESGLLYVVLTQGTGKMPKLTDKVKVNYHGTLPDGTVFDSSKNGESAGFAVNGVISGWTEALQMMPVGSKYKLIVPPDLAYGRRGARPPIGPNAVLIFELELLEIEKPVVAK